MFLDIPKTLRLASGIALGTNPLYVQFYITARCNLTCQQCNIIYANSDVRECSIPEIQRIAENLRKIGVVMVLLTGGEPFVRSDLPEIVRAFSDNGVHVRMQTNGLATEEALSRCVENGAHDISISLDSLVPTLQDSINGGFPGSWEAAIEAISMVTRVLPKENSFASFGCVLAPTNIEHIEHVLRLGTEIGWYTSLVPIHVTSRQRPMDFRTYDSALDFKPEVWPRVDASLDRMWRLKKEGQLLYDSHEYFEDIKRFIRKEPTQWRRKNAGVCDSPSLYFAILPNGDLSVCCDHRLPPASRVSTLSPDFPKVFRTPEFRKRVGAVTRACPGCMFGSYPEMTISARFLSATLERARVFLSRPIDHPWPVSADRLREIAARIRSDHPLADVASAG